jgi:2-oxoisovalerate dehydrogenase E1 component alpha subunit
VSDPKKAGLSLHIPEPRTRPGDAPDFSDLMIPPAGLARRPEIDADEDTIRDLSFDLIRVLDDQGRAVGPWAPDIDPEVLRKGLKAMMLTRLFDDRMFNAHRQGKTSFYMKSTGEEAIACAQSLAMRSDDMCFPTYRLVGWLMARDYPLLDMVNQIVSTADDPLQGRQLPVMYSARAYGFYTISGGLGARFGHAVGWAMASAYRGDDTLAIAHVGEGTTAEGAFHEALTFASVYRAPVILNVTNNQWAISSYQGIAGGEETTFASKAIGYGVPGLRVDGNDFLAVYAATQWAADRARANLGPTLIELFTYRVAGHSTSDDPTRYRPKDDGSLWPLGDPVERLKQHLVRIGQWSEERHAQMGAELFDEVRTAVKAGEAIGSLGKSKPDPATMFEDIFKTPDWRHEEQKREAGF